MAVMDPSTFCKHEGSFKGYPVECELPIGHTGNHCSKGLLPQGLLTWSTKTAIPAPICARRIAELKNEPKAVFISDGVSVSVSAIEISTSPCIYPPNHIPPHMTWERYWEKQAKGAQKPTITTLDNHFAQAEEIALVIPPAEMIPLPPATRPKTKRERRRALLRKQQQK